MLIDPARLTVPVDNASPCGEDLEYDAAFIALQDAAETRPEQQVGGSIIPAQEPDWPAVARDALDLLDRCRDLRIASILAEAVLRTDGLTGFAAVLEAVRGWLEQYWDDLHPRLDPDDDNDPTMRVNAMRAFASGETVLRALRTAPLTESRGLGRFTWRDLLIATGEMPAPDGEKMPDLASIGAAFEDTDAGIRAATVAATARALEHARAIDGILSGKIGTDGPDLDPLIKALQKLGQMLATHARLEAPVTDEPATAGIEGTAPEPGAETAAVGGANPARTGQPGTIGNRDDVIRTLDRICEFYERTEPSSPVPLLLKRARRLVNADFTTIIRDMASDGYDQVVRIAGIVEK